MKKIEAQFTERIPDTAQLHPHYYDKLKFPFVKMPYAFKLCEGSPVESTAVVLEAFSKLPQYTLVVMCNWNYSENGVWLRKMYGAFSNIIMLDAAYSLREISMLKANCFLYLHGAKNSSTKTALLEAMHCGLPVIAFAEPANQAATGNKASYFKTADELKNIILQKKIADLKKMGAEMKAIATGFMNASRSMDTTAELN
jgi:hypothetical protein